MREIWIWIFWIFGKIFIIYYISAKNENEKFLILSHSYTSAFQFASALVCNISGFLVSNFIKIVIWVADAITYTKPIGMLQFPHVYCTNRYNIYIVFAYYLQRISWFSSPNNSIIDRFGGIFTDQSTVQGEIESSGNFVDVKHLCLVFTITNIKPQTHMS